MAGNPLAKFFATVGFKADTSALDATIKRVKQELQSITGSVKSSSAYKKAKQVEAKDFNNHIYAYKKHMIGVNKQIQKTSEKTLEVLGVKRKAQMQEEGAKQKELAKMGDFYRKDARLAEKKARESTLTALKENSSKKAKQIQEEFSSQLELRKMGDFYRKQESQQLKKEVKEKQGLEKLHAQALRDNIAYDKRKERAMWQEAQFLNKEYNLKEKNRKAEEASQKRIQERQQRFAERMKLAEIRARTREMAIASRERIAALNHFSPATTGGVGGLTARGALGSLGALGFATQAFKVGNFQAAQPAQYEFLTGSKEGGQKQITYINKLVDDLKLNLMETDAIYKQFLGATVSTIGVEKTQQTFKTLNTFAVMMGASGDQMKRGIKAVQQMLSKQKLSAEELTGQMAEANLIPGATQVFADKLEGGDVKKLFANMQKGKYTLEDIVSVLDSLESKIKQSQLDQMLMRPTAELEEMRTAWVRFIEVFNKQGGLALQKALFDEITIGIKAATKWLKNNKEEFKAIGKIVSEVYSVVKLAFGMLIILISNAAEAVWAFVLIFKNFFSEDILGGLLKVIPLVGILTTMLYAFPALAKAVAVAGARMWAAFIVPAAVIGAILLVDDLINALLGRDSLIAGAAKEDGFLGTLAATFLMIGETLSLIGQLFTSIFVEGDLQLAGIYVDEFFKKFKDNFPKLSSLFSDLATWVSSLFSNIAKRFGMMIGVAKAYASLDFKKVNELISKMEGTSLSPTAQQMNPQDYMRSLPASSYKNVPPLLSNNPQQNIIINAGNQSPEQIAMEIRKQWDSIASMSYTQSMTNYGALQ